MKSGRIERKQYNIYHFDFNLMFLYGEIKNDKLVLNENAAEMSKVKNNNGCEKKGDCQLFNQTIKVLKLKDNNRIFEKIFIIVDFSNFVKNKRDYFIINLNKIRGGIVLNIDGEDITFVDFLKSNSMSKKCCMFYVNNMYKDLIEKRISFGFNKDNLKIKMAKWYAYSGLCVSDSIILEDIKLKKNNIVIIPDSIYPKRCNRETPKINCITAISIKQIWEKMSNIESQILQSGLSKNSAIRIDNCPNEFRLKDDILELKYTFASYKNSKDLYDIDGEEDEILKDLIISLSSGFDMTIKDFYGKIVECKRKHQSYYDSKVDGKKEIYWKKMNVENFPVEVNKFDGEGIITKEFCKEINDSLSKKAKISNGFFGHSFQIRLPFIKGVVHSCDFKKFCLEHNISTIRGKNYSSNNEDSFIDYDIKDIKLILTESQFKAASFINTIERNALETPFDAFMKLFEEYDYAFSISNLEPKNNNIVSLNYQFLSTIPFSKEDLDRLCSSNKKLFEEAISPESITKGLEENNDNIFLSENEEDFFNDFDYNDDDIIDDDIEKDRRLLHANKDYYLSSSRFTSRRYKIGGSIKKKHKCMNLKSEGYRRFICSDLLELLYHICFHNTPEDDTYNKYLKNTFYAPGVKCSSPNAYCIFLRNPHYSFNEIGLLKKAKKDDERERYFGQLKGIVMVDPLSFIPNRLGGADYDGDECVILNQHNRLSVIRKILDGQQPIIIIPSLGCGSVPYGYDERIKCIYNTFSSEVGKISNNALKASFNSVDSDKLAFYSIICGLEIDSAKQGIKPRIDKCEENNKYAELFIDFKNKCKKKNQTNTAKGAIEIGDCGELETSNNIFYIYKKIEDDYKYDNVKDDSVRSKIKEKSKIIIENNQSNYKEALIIYSAYKHVTRFLDKLKYIKKKRKNDDNDKKLIIYLKDDLFPRKQYNNNPFTFLSKFETENPLFTLDKYCLASKKTNGLTKYHYLTDYFLKKEFITDYLKIEGLNEDDFDLVTDFSNNGYHLLFWVLCYNAKKYLENNDCTVEQIKYDEFKKDDKYWENALESKYSIDNIVKKMSINIDDINYCNEKVRNLTLNILEKLTDYKKGVSIKNIKDEADTIFDKLFKEIRLVDLLPFVDVFNDGIVFKFFFDELIDFISDGGQKNE